MFRVPNSITMSLHELSSVKMRNDYVRNLLRRYYSAADFHLPNDFVLREFAFQQYSSRTYIRHFSFQSKALLKEYLITHTPRQAYYSAALYRDPAAEKMEDKDWIGSELMFDIDSDHIIGCKYTELQVNSLKVTIISKECIELAKDHVLRLLDILKNDFGFSKDEILVYFSGNRGFHVVVHPSDEEWLKLNPYLRREIVDYIKGIGLDLDIVMPKPRKGIILHQLPSECGGWRGRIAEKAGNYSEALANVSTILNELTVSVDEQVTQDISRLIRIPGTINGKSGIPARILPTESHIVEFEYGPHLSPFQGYAAVTLNIRKLPRNINVLGHEIIASTEIQKLPLPVAIFLALNDLAIIKSII